jgi:hypothetical protein
MSITYFLSWLRTVKTRHINFCGSVICSPTLSFFNTLKHNITRDEEKRKNKIITAPAFWKKKNRSFSRVKVIVYPICPFYISLLQTIWIVYIYVCSRFCMWIQDLSANTIWLFLWVRINQDLSPPNSLIKIALSQIQTICWICLLSYSNCVR